MLVHVMHKLCNGIKMSFKIHSLDFRAHRVDAVAQLSGNHFATATLFEQVRDFLFALGVIFRITGHVCDDWEGEANVGKKVAADSQIYLLIKSILICESAAVVLLKKLIRKNLPRIQNTFGVKNIFYFFHHAQLRFVESNAQIIFLHKADAVFS